MLRPRPLLDLGLREDPASCSSLVQWACQLSNVEAEAEKRK